MTLSFLNVHLHLDKAYTLDMASDDALLAYTSGRWAAR